MQQQVYYFGPDEILKARGVVLVLLDLIQRIATTDDTTVQAGLPTDQFSAELKAATDALNSVTAYLEIAAKHALPGSVAAPPAA